MDCNDNEIRDACDIANETSADCDGDGVPDECQLYGRCCLIDETCIHTRTNACCIAAGGFYLFGLGTNCHAQCPQGPLGPQPG